MNNYRLEIEQLILSSILYQDLQNELDKCEFEDYIIPYEIFKATLTTKLIAKAIFRVQELKQPVSEITVLNFLDEKVKIDQIELINLLAKLNVTFETMLKYVKMLNDIDIEQTKLDILRDI